MVTDIQLNEWTREAGVHIATNFDREMFRRFAEVVLKNADPNYMVPVTRQKKKTDEEK